MSVTPEKKERFHFLDGLRGIASLMIVIHHSFTSNIVKLLAHVKLPVVGFYFAYFTQSGVELFFVLSGIVLLRPYLRGERKFKTGEYFIRRIKRIYFPYWAALLFAVFVSWYITAYPTWYNIKVYHMPVVWWEVLREAFIIDTMGCYYNLAWWSLGIELVFYLLVPLILFVLPSKYKPGNGQVALMLVITLLVSIGLQLWLTEYYPQIYSYKHMVATVYQFISYPVCFLLGVFLAARDFKARDAYAFILPGVLLVGASWFYLPIVNAGYGLIYAGVIILAFNVASFRHFLSRPIMVWFGERSYSIFLVHFSVFYLVDNLAALFTSERNIWYGVLSRGAGIPIAIFAGMLLFHFVERRQARGLVTGHIFWPWQVKRLWPDA